MNTMRPARLSTVVIAGICMAGCGGGGGGGGSGGSGPSTLTGSVTPSVAPANTSGSNQTTTLPSGIQVSGTAVVGESVLTGQATTTLPGTGTAVEVRHGFFPSVDGIAPSGSG